MDGDSPSAYCTNCGESLAASMNFCPNCGTATSGGDGSSASTDREAPADDDWTIDDRDVLEHRIRIAMNEGWELEHDFGDHAVLIKRSFGGALSHVVVAVFTLAWTMGIGNVLYATYSYFGNPTRTVIGADGGADGRTEPTAFERVMATITALLLWAIAAIFAAFVAVVGTASPVAAAILLTLTFVFAAAGLATFPPTKRRLDERGPLTKHGRVRETDERRIADPDADCVECGGVVDRGLERTYRDEVALFGVPLTKSEGTNVYCRRCVRAEERFSEPAIDERGTNHDADQNGSRADRDVELERV